MCLAIRWAESEFVMKSLHLDARNEKWNFFFVPDSLTSQIENKECSSSLEFSMDFIIPSSVVYLLLPCAAAAAIVFPCCFHCSKSIFSSQIYKSPSTFLHPMMDPPFISPSGRGKNYEFSAEYVMILQPELNQKKRFTV